MKFVWDKKRKLLFFINKLLPFKSFKYFNFFGIMVTRIKDVLKDFTDMAARHEGTHTIQMLEVGILPYYPLYVEARMAQYEVDYYESRKVFQYKWIKRIWR